MKPTVNIHPSQSVLAITLACVMLFIYTGERWLLTAALFLGFGGLLSERLAGWIHAGWMMLSSVLGYIGPRVFLTIIFFLVLTPMAIVYRLTGNDELRLKYRPGSLFVPREKEVTARSMEKTW